MKSLYYPAIRTIIAKHMHKSRKELALTQAQMAERLELDLRSYSNIENDKSLCNTKTFMLYLLYTCTDPNGLLAELKAEMDVIKKEVEEQKKLLEEKLREQKQEQEE